MEEKKKVRSLLKLTAQSRSLNFSERLHGNNLHHVHDCPGDLKNKTTKLKSVALKRSACTFILQSFSMIVEGRTNCFQESRRGREHEETVHSTQAQIEMHTKAQ